MFRGREHQKFRYVLHLPAVLHGGDEPDLLDEVAWWNTDDFWSYAVYVLAIHAHLAAKRLGDSMPELCARLVDRHHLTI